MCRFSKYRPRVRLWRSRAAREDGNSTIEFTLCLPVFLLLFCSTFELGLAMTRMTMLEHGLDRAMRNVRMATAQVITQDSVRDQICDAAAVLKNCRSNLMIEMTRIDSDTWALPDPTARCVDRSGQGTPVTSFVNGRQSDIMFIRACYVIDPLFPAFGLGAMIERDHTGGMFLTASSAFSQEPL